MTGVIQVDANETSRLTPVLNPTIYYVNSLRDTLIRKGIEVSGAAVDIDDVMDEARPASPLRTLIAHQSPPLSEIGTTFMKVSQNTFGETLMTTIGARSGRAEKFVERGRRPRPDGTGVASTQHAGHSGAGAAARAALAR